MARAVNMGISGVIDSNGRVLRPETKPPLTEAGEVKLWSIPVEKSDWKELPVGEWSQYKAVAGVLLATVPIDSRWSLYACCGDWLPWSCWLLLGLLAVFVRWRAWGVSP